MKTNELKERIPEVTALLNAGIRPIRIAETLRVTPGTLSEFVRWHIPPETLAIPCQHCGRVMDPRWGLQHHCHTECTRLFYQRKRRASSWHPRTQPVGEFEQMALQAYKQRGFAVTWMPFHAEFDYLVNGQRVDVKGAHINAGKRWAFATACYKNRDKTATPSFPRDRCDLVHCIGERDDELTHFIIPAQKIESKWNIAIPPVPTSISKWWAFHDHWELFECHPEK